MNILMWLSFIHFLFDNFFWLVKDRLFQRLLQLTKKRKKSMLFIIFFCFTWRMDLRLQATELLDPNREESSVLGDRNINTNLEKIWWWGTEESDQGAVWRQVGTNQKTTMHTSQPVPYWHESCAQVNRPWLPVKEGLKMLWC